MGWMLTDTQASYSEDLQVDLRIINGVLLRNTAYTAYVQVLEFLLSDALLLST